MPQHSALTGADLHEPKGADTASANTVYVADGLGSGTWQTITPNQQSQSRGFITVTMPTIGTAKSIYIPFTRAAQINRVTSVIDAAITGANNVFTIYNSAGASMGTITVAFSGSAAGDIDTNASLANNTVSAQSYIRIASDGGDTSTNANAIFMIEFTLT